jgi:hypothetical protein
MKGKMNGKYTLYVNDWCNISKDLLKRLTGDLSNVSIVTGYSLEDIEEEPRLACSPRLYSGDKVVGLGKEAILTVLEEIK